MFLGDLRSSYLDYARERYVRSDGSATGQAVNLFLCLRSLPACICVQTFGPSELMTYRDGLVARGMNRRTINQWVGWVKGAMRWAVRQGHYSPLMLGSLSAVEPLRISRGCPESVRRCRPPSRVELLTVAAAAPGLVGSMLRVQYLAGMRPAEVCNMKWTELDPTSCGSMIYRPARHKLEHHGRDRQIVLTSEACSFLPVAKSAGHVFRHRRGGPYSADSYGQAVRRTCRRLGVRIWSPATVRRAAATAARRIGGAQSAKWLLGHSSTEMTERYYDLRSDDVLSEVSRLSERGFSLL